MNKYKHTRSAAYEALMAAELPSPNPGIPSEQWFAQFSPDQYRVLRHYLLTAARRYANGFAQCELDNIVDGILAHHANPRLYPNRKRYRVDNVFRFCGLLRVSVKNAVTDAVHKGMRFSADLEQIPEPTDGVPHPSHHSGLDDILSHPAIDAQQRRLIGMLAENKRQSAIMKHMGLPNQPAVCRTIQRTMQKIRSIPEFSL